MITIEFNGDPMIQLEEFKQVIGAKIFYLNQNSYDEIKSYTYELKENIPQFFDNVLFDSILFAEGGIDENGEEFPDTYIAIKNVFDGEKDYKISGIYASDMQYKAPDQGDEILLKKTEQISREQKKES